MLLKALLDKGRALSLGICGPILAIANHRFCSISPRALSVLSNAGDACTCRTL